MFASFEELTRRFVSHKWALLGYGCYLAIGATGAGVALWKHRPLGLVLSLLAAFSGLSGLKRSVNTKLVPYLELRQDTIGYHALGFLAIFFRIAPLVESQKSIPPTLKQCPLDRSHPLG
jgi:hypothetical protein